MLELACWPTAQCRLPSNSAFFDEGQRFSEDDVAITRRPTNVLTPAAGIQLLHHNTLVQN